MGERLGWNIVSRGFPPPLRVMGFHHTNSSCKLKYHFSRLVIGASGTKLSTNFQNSIWPCMYQFDQKEKRKKPSFQHKSLYHKS